MKYKQQTLEFEPNYFAEERNYTVTWWAPDVTRNPETREIEISEPRKKTTIRHMTKTEAEDFKIFLIEFTNGLQGEPKINYVQPI